MYTSALSGFKHAPALMHRYLPDLKLIYVVRHPMDRIVSQWRHRKGKYPSTKDFKSLMSSSFLRKLVVGCSLYHEQLERFREFYPDKQIHCLTFEDLVSEPHRTLTNLLQFLGAANGEEQVDQLLDGGKLPRENEAGEKGRTLIEPPEWTPQLYDKVLKVVQPDAEKILDYMEKPQGTWTFEVP